MTLRQSSWKNTHAKQTHRKISFFFFRKISNGITRWRFDIVTVISCPVGDDSEVGVLASV